MRLRLDGHDDDVSQLVAFLSILHDVSDAEFRELILESKLLDTSQDIEGDSKKE